MFIAKRYPFWGLVNWSKRYIYIFLVLDIIPILFYKIFNWDWLIILWQPIALIGIAVSFYLGFKNNSSYDRLWEARKIWGGIVNASRTFTVMSRDFISNEHTKEIRKRNSRYSYIYCVSPCGVAKGTYLSVKNAKTLGTFKKN